MTAMSCRTSSKDGRSQCEAELLDKINEVGADGHRPSEFVTEFQDTINEVDADGNSATDFPEFWSEMARTGWTPRRNSSKPSKCRTVPSRWRARHVMTNLDEKCHATSFPSTFSGPSSIRTSSDCCMSGASVCGPTHS